MCVLSQRCYGFGRLWPEKDPNPYPNCPGRRPGQFGSGCWSVTNGCTAKAGRKPAPESRGAVTAPRLPAMCPNVSTECTGRAIQARIIERVGDNIAHDAAPTCLYRSLCLCLCACSASVFPATSRHTTPIKLNVVAFRVTKIRRLLLVRRHAFTSIHEGPPGGRSCKGPKGSRRDSIFYSLFVSVAILAQVDSSDRGSSAPSDA